MELTKATEVMKEVLGLTYEPIAVKFLTKKTRLDGFEMPSDRRYCQILMGAREGRNLLLTVDNISCPAAAWALGFKEPPTKLSSGEMPAGMGIFASPAAAKHTLDTMPRLEGQIPDGGLLPSRTGTLRTGYRGSRVGGGASDVGSPRPGI